MDPAFSCFWMPLIGWRLGIKSYYQAKVYFHAKVRGFRDSLEVRLLYAKFVVCGMLYFHVFITTAKSCQICYYDFAKERVHNFGSMR